MDVATEERIEETAVPTVGEEVASVEQDANDEVMAPGESGPHSCDGECCKKKPGEYCADDNCNCGAAGNHATLPKPEVTDESLDAEVQEHLAHEPSDEEVRANDEWQADFAERHKRIANPIVLSEQQNEALEAILLWLQDPTRLEFRLGGPAGTGKTTLIKALMSKVRIPTEIVSFTGKAVAVLRKKGLWQARTLHSLLYKAQKDADGKIHWVPRSHLYDCDFVIVDEASMISKDLYRDLRAHGVKMLFVGDPFQLEPVGDNPNLLHELDYLLTEVHRQAKQSPILRLATAVRNGLDVLPVGSWERDSSSLFIVNRMDAIDDRYDAIVCGKNATRHRINALRRSQRGYDDILHEGETVLCLKNAKDYGVFNGMTFKVKKIYKSALYMSVGKIVCDLEDDLGQEYPDVPIQRDFFGKDYKWDKDKNRNAIPFDYGYALTAHKSQGSEWDNVLVIDEPTWGCDTGRWRYTAITRAAKNLTIAL